MSKFKAGDKVRRLASPASNYLKVGGVYTVAIVRGSHEISLVERPGRLYMDRYFELVEEEVDSKDEWSFTVSSDKLISLSEIHGTLTRERPMAIVYKGDKVAFLLHQCVYDKARVLGGDYMRNLQTALSKYTSWHDKRSSVIDPVIKAVRDIRNAEVPDSEPVEVKVKLLKV